MPSPGRLPNRLLTEARERLLSPSGAPRPMSRQELAEAVNAYIWHRYQRAEHLDHTDIGKLERGQVRWPGPQRREALRAVLGVAADREIGLYLHRSQAHGGLPGTVLHRRAVMGDEGDGVNRRELLAASSAAAAGVVLPSCMTATDGLAGVASMLIGHGSGTPEELVDEMTVAQAAVRAKRDYQAGRYWQVVDALPGLLAVARAVGEHHPAGSGVDAVAADAYQTAGSVLLKLGEPGLALLAADRSTAAAYRSGDPVAIGASARALAHALASNGHPSHAVTAALTGARELEQASGLATAPALAVYGALLLRAASLAARREDRATAMGLLSEAQDTAKRLHSDGNSRWTYFCAPNVTLHRVSVAVSLGDAGQAIAHARQVDPDRILLSERRACFYLDLTRAFTQWGRHEQAYEALCAAERAAPQEVAARPTGRALVVELRRRCPPSLQRPMQQLADRIGTTA